VGHQYTFQIGEVPVRYSTFAICVLACQVLGCSKEHPENGAVVLQFQSYLTDRPVYCEIRVNSDFDEFSKPEDVNEFSILPSLVECSLDIRNKVKEIKKNAISIIDSSPDQNWVAARYMSTGINPYNNVVLLNIKKSEVIKEIPYCSNVYLLNNIGFYNDLFDLKKINFTTNDCNTLGQAQTFFMLPDRMQLVLFMRGQINKYDLGQQSSQLVGTNYGPARFSGAIDSNWGYYVAMFPKESIARLYFLNLKTFKSIRYPYNLPPGTVVGIQRPSDEKRDK
jgi:hypothetical protein